MGKPKVIPNPSGFTGERDFLVPIHPINTKLPQQTGIYQANWQTGKLEKTEMTSMRASWQLPNDALVFSNSKPEDVHK